MNPADERSSRRIRVLREDVARKIAAGEVIDRPFSVVRELLDNAIDAGPATVECSVEEGGISRVRVVDDGAGMTREDLDVCFLRHATSKIREEEDLYRVTTLGFRGEALAAIGTCARLEIVSQPAGAGGAASGACRLVVHGGRRLLLEGCPGRPGTAVDVSDLFFNMPARRRFLKSRQAETAMCRQAFLEKAIPHAEIAFRLLVDGALKLFLPAAGLKERVAGAAGLEPAHLSLLEDTARDAAGFRIRVVAGRPELSRPDRRSVQIYVNRRRVQEYGLAQAVEYAYSEYQPGGRYPVAFVFVEADPDLADFNIHPAKREVRLRNLPEIRQRLVGLLKAHLGGFGLRPREPGAERETGPGGLQPMFPAAPPDAPGRPSDLRPATARLDWTELARWTETHRQPTGGFGGGFRAPDSPVPGAAPGSPEAAGPAPLPAPLYRGRLFGLFLLAELGDRLYIVDQHAAHERLIYERLQAREVRPQELLFPIRLEVNGDEEAELRGRDGTLEAMGVRLERVGPGEWQVTALPEDFLAIEERTLAAALTGAARSAEELRQSLLSLAACRLAVKDGDTLDPLAAQQLLSESFTLANARCPHGRPIWYSLGREELLRAVGRPPETPPAG